MIIDPAAAIVKVNVDNGQIVSVYGGGGSESACCCCCASDALFFSFSLYVGGAAVDDEAAADDGPGAEGGAEEEDGNAEEAGSEDDDEEATAKEGGRSSSDGSGVENDVPDVPLCSLSAVRVDACKLAFQLDDDWNGGGPCGGGDCDEDAASTGVGFSPGASNTETVRGVAEGLIGERCVWGRIFEIIVVACSGGDELDCGIGRDSADARANCFRAGGHTIGSVAPC